MTEGKEGLAWKESFRLGNEEVDSQHKKLFELLGDIIESAADSGGGGEKLKAHLNFLADYAVSHFDYEERLQRECLYPDYENHKLAHDDFKQTVARLTQRFLDDGSTDKLARDINKVVARWLVNHIVIEDQKIGKHMKNLYEDYNPRSATKLSK